VLAACSGGDAAPEGGTSGPSGADATGAPAQTDLVALSEVPVGGALSVDGPDGPLIVAQPTQGEAVAFSAICTHQGCTVAPDGDRLRCPCHGSVYEAATGRNIEGPAPRPLDKVTVQVVDGEVVAG
jgi:Rieske Fe-S protein